jgi:hypothetical protein
MAAPITAWSYSRFSMYEQCPYKFKCTVIDKQKEPESAAMARGQEMHKALALYIEGKSATLPAAVQTPFQRKLVDEVRAFPDKVVEQQWGFTSRWEPTGWFSKDTWWRCVLDVALLHHEARAGDVADWKSGKPRDTNIEQLELNALAFMCKFPRVLEVSSRMVYLDAGVEHVADFHMRDKEKLQAKWEAKVVPMFSDTQFLPRPSRLCAYCHLARSNGGECRYG